MERPRSRLRLSGASAVYWIDFGRHERNFSTMDLGFDGRMVAISPALYGSRGVEVVVVVVVVVVVIVFGFEALVALVVVLLDFDDSVLVSI